jgi:DHA2 family multidrug resistance protein
VVYAAVASGLAFILLIVRELKFGEPIIDVRIFKQGVFIVAVTLSIAMSFVLFGSILMSPLFLQELMGYTAWKAGVVQAPRGLGSMFSMMMMGQLARGGINTRPFVGLGFALVAASSWVISGWDLQIGVWSVIWPNVTMALGFGMIFPNTSAAALTCVPPERIGYASSLFNMMRNTGAAIGIAYMTNSLLSRQQVHQSRLVEHFSVFDAWKLHNMGPHLPGVPAFGQIFTSGTGPQVGMIYGAVQAQSAMLAFNDIYWIIAIGLIPLIPLFLLLPSSKRMAGGSPPAH